MKHYQRTALWIICSVGLVAGESALAADTELKTEEDKTFYFIGTAVGSNLANLGLEGAEIDIVVQGIRDVLAGDAIKLDEATYSARVNTLAQERAAAVATVEKGAADAYIAEMAAEDGATTTDSGIVILEIVVGTGASPTAESVIKAHYHGTMRDGTVFDSSVERGQPFEMGLAQVIPCWREAIPTMKVGGKIKITCPSDLAYGDRGTGAIPPGAALTFEVELIEIIN
jgi:FKBP-type peptidyl-prolyl cis-trans isomerase FkpA